jgi:hypothetical protein
MRLRITALRYEHFSFYTQLLVLLTFTFSIWGNGVAAKNVNVTVGRLGPNALGLAFIPNEVFADIGDTVTFIFFPLVSVHSRSRYFILFMLSLISTHLHSPPLTSSHL